MAPRGFTLVELLVVLVLMGLAASLTPLTWRGVPSPPAGRTVAEVATTARRLAIDRGAAVDLVLDSAGHWWIRSVGTGDTLRTGQVAAYAPGHAHAVRVDALGLCRPLDSGAPGGAPFDMAACGPLEETRAGPLAGGRP